MPLPVGRGLSAGKIAARPCSNTLYGKTRPRSSIANVMSGTDDGMLNVLKAGLRSADRGCHSAHTLTWTRCPFPPCPSTADRSVRTCALSEQFGACGAFRIRPRQLVQGDVRRQPHGGCAIVRLPRQRTALPHRAPHLVRDRDRLIQTQPRASDLIDDGQARSGCGFPSAFRTMRRSFRRPASGRTKRRDPMRFGRRSTIRQTAKARRLSRPTPIGSSPHGRPSRRRCWLRFPWSGSPAVWRSSPGVPALKGSHRARKCLTFPSNRQP